jgi:hypothetical protein
MPDGHAREQGLHKLLPPGYSERLHGMILRQQRRWKVIWGGARRNVSNSYQHHCGHRQLNKHWVSGRRICWRTFVQAERGEPHLASSISGIPHRARRLLHHLRSRRGAGVPMTTPPWTQQQVMATAKRGSHKSAQQDYVEFVCKEMIKLPNKGLGQFSRWQTLLPSRTSDSPPWALYPNAIDDCS